MAGFEENEISQNAFGGTEIAKRKLTTMLDPELLDNFQIICSRPRTLEQDKIRIFWAHDLAEDPESNKFKDPSFLKDIHKFVFVSNWQYGRYQLIHGLPYDEKSIILESGIEPADPFLRYTEGDGKIRLVYTSTPQRGLEILVPAFEALAKKHPEIHLDVFSSFKIYGWNTADAPFEKLFDRCKNHPQITYYGFVPNIDLKTHLNKSHIFAYPSIWLETSCRAMLEAMSAGLICVHPNFGALPETSGGLNMMYNGSQNNNVHVNIFTNHLDAAIQMYKNNLHKNMIDFNKIFVDSRYNINRIKNQWEMMLKQLLAQYPTLESRKKQTETFIYRTL